MNDGTLTIAFSTAESAQKPTETGRGKTTVHITNIPRTLFLEDLRRAFSLVGEIDSLKLGDGKAEITFSNAESVHQLAEAYKGDQRTSGSIKAKLIESLRGKGVSEQRGGYDAAEEAFTMVDNLFSSQFHP